MDSCPGCTRDLDEGLLYLDAHEHPVREQAKAAWKSCPRCSQIAGVHVFLRMADFGSPVKGRQTDRNPAGLQSDCSFHRNNANKDIPRPAGARRLCGDSSASRAAGGRRDPVLRKQPRP